MDALVAGHGERPRNPLRPSVRRRAGPHARHLPPTLRRDPPRHVRGRVAALHLRRPHPAAARPAGGDRRPRRHLHADDPPAALRPGRRVPDVEVPAGTEQGVGADVDRRRDPGRAGGAVLAVRGGVRVGGDGGAGGLRPDGVGDGGGAVRVRGGVVQGELDRVHAGGV